MVGNALAFIANNMSDFKKRLCLFLMIMTLVACGGGGSSSTPTPTPTPTPPPPVNPDLIVEGTFDETGGVLIAPDTSSYEGLSLTIPQGALSGATEIALEASDIQIPDRAVSDVIRIVTDATLLKPVELTLRYEADNVAEHTARHDLILSRFINENSWLMLQERSVDLAASIISAKTMEQGQFFIHLPTPDNQIQAPLADAGFPQVIAIGDTVFLDGSGSTSPNHQLLTFSWQFESLPDESEATLNNSTSITPSFTPDVEGKYILSLSVSDDSYQSLPTYITLSTGNVPPVAIAKSLEFAAIGSTVKLDASDSISPDGDAIVYQWELLETPQGSSTFIEDADQPVAALFLDNAGAYFVRLSASDNDGAQSQTHLRIDTEQSAPIAKISVTSGTATITVGEQIQLSAENSTHKDGDELSFYWSLISHPANSDVAIITNTGLDTAFTPDLDGEYLIQLTATDSAGNKSHNTLSLDTQNTTPVANAGSDIIIVENVDTVIDTSLSIDGDGDNIVTELILLHRPENSEASLDVSQPLQAVLYRDLDGDYIVQIEVDDSKAAPEFDTAFISTQGIRPIARNQALDDVPAQEFQLGERLILRPPADVVTSQLSLISKPEESEIIVNVKNSPESRITPDVIGDYVFQIITENERFGSIARTYRYKIIPAIPVNQPPVADITTAQTEVNIAEEVLLSGSGSFDPDGDDISYLWSLISVPDGSNAALSEPNSIQTALTPDISGAYIVQLIVNDGEENSEPAQITITANTRPVAQITPSDAQILLGESIVFDGTGSSDADNDDITFQWSLAQSPEDSTIAIENSTASQITLQPDVTGTYVVELIVSDAKQESEPALATLSVTEVPNGVPVIADIAEQDIQVDTAFSLAIEASDPDGDVLSYALSNEPLGMMISATGLISWTPREDGNYPITVLVSDDISTSEANFTIKVSGASEQSPVFEIVGAQIVRLGTRLDLQLSATDPAALPVLFRAIPASLPKNMSLNTQTGLFSFRPDGDQVGVYNITIGASNGRFETLQNINITVPEPDGITRLRGRALTLNDDGELVGLAGVRFEMRGVEDFTDANGEFFLDNLPDVTGHDANRLMVDGSVIPPQGSYAQVPEIIRIVEGASNILESDVVLLPLDVASGDMVSPTQNAIVDSSPIPLADGGSEPVVMSVPAGAAVDEFTGEPYEGIVHISEVADPSLGPQPLPPEFDLSVYIAMQPFGVVYPDPVPISFPNKEGFPPGSRMDIFALNHETGVMEKIGEALVSSDGRTINSIGGVVRSNSWHGIVPQAPVLSQDKAADQAQPMALNPEQTEQPDGKCCNGVCEDCAVDPSTGNLSEWHTVPAYYSLGETRSLSIEYNSTVAFPAPIINQVAGFGNDAPPPFAMSALLEINGLELVPELFSEVRVEPSDIRGQFKETRPSLQFSAESFETGIYDYFLETHCYFEISRRSDTLQGQIIIENQMNSAIGAGWTISGLQRLYQGENGEVLITTGTSSSFIYRLNEDGAYDAPTGDFSELRADSSTGTFIRTSKNGTQYHFDEAGLLSRKIDRNGNETQYLYDMDERLTSIVDPVGQRFELSYRNGKLRTISDPLGRTTQFTHDSAGNLTAITEPNGDIRSFEYEEEPHLLTAQTDQRGNRKIYEYNFAHRISATVSADGARTEYMVADIQGLLNSEEFEASLDNLAPAPPLLESIERQHIDKNGNPLIAKIDGRNMPTELQDALGRTYLIVRDEDSNPITSTRPNLSVINSEFDERGNVLNSTEEDISATSSFEYDALSLITSATNPNEHTTTFNRDENGNMTSVVNELGHTTLYDYDERGLVAKVTTPNLLVIEYDYNDQGLVETITQTPPDNSPGETRITRYRYDAAGQTEQITTPDLITLDLVYDDKGRLESVTDNLNQTITYSYDAFDNLTQVDTHNDDGSLALRLSHSYDVRNRHASSSMPHIDESFSTTQYKFDGNNNVTETLDPKLQVSNAMYDAEDRLRSFTHRLNGVTEYDYDSNDRLTSITAPNGVITQYTYDNLGRRLSEQSPDRGTITYTYDKANNLTTMTDGRGIITEYAYDELERVISKNYPANPQENVTYTWDNCQFGIGRICEIEDESGRHSYQYDAFGNVVNHGWITDNLTENNASLVFATTYSYDNGNNITEIGYPIDRSVAYQRDGLRRINGISTETFFGDVTSNTIISDMQYRADNQLLQCDFGNGLTDTRSYDLQGRLLSQSIGALDNRSYRYDANSNIEERNTTPQFSAYDYDPLDRLTSDAIDGDEPHSFDYDLNDNRLSKNQSTENSDTHNISGSSNRLLSREIFSDTSLSPLPPLREFSYNNANRLFEVYDNGDLIARYYYQDNGLRSHKILFAPGNAETPLSIIYYHYDLSGRLIQESDPEFNLAHEYIWGDDYSPVAQVEADGDIYYLHTDHMMTPRYATDADGIVVWRWDGEAFGETAAIPNTLTVNLRFPGQYFDSETGNHYNWNRYYDATIGRYLQSDPIGLNGGLNTYGYAGQNSLRVLDVMGLSTISLSIHVKAPTFPGSPTIGDTDAKPRGISAGVAFSYPDSFGGEFDLGAFGSISVGGNVGIGKITGSLTIEEGAVRDLNEDSIDLSFNYKVGGLSIGLDEQLRLNSFGIHLGKGYEVAIEHTQTKVFSLREVIEEIINKHNQEKLCK